MEFEKFLEKVKNAVQAYFGENLRLTVSNVLKNNGVTLSGLIFMCEDSEVASTIYLNGFYEEYSQGQPFGEIVRRICAVYEENKPDQDLNMDFFNDYAKVRPKLACRLIHYEKNRQLLEKLPHRRFLDMAVVYCCIMMSDRIGCACVLINDSHMELWQASEEQLYQDTMDNMPRVLPVEFSSMDDFMFDVIRKAIQDKMEETPEEDSDGCQAMLDEVAEILVGWPKKENPERKMYILTNKQRFYGAASILYPGVLKKYADTRGCDFFIFPSSVHEVILLTDTGIEDREHLYDMVHEVNCQNVPQEELLSDSVYYFSRESGRITIL